LHEQQGPFPVVILSATTVVILSATKDLSWNQPLCDAGSSAAAGSRTSSITKQKGSSIVILSEAKDLSQVELTAPQSRKVQALA
jgi:hypothetical protein